MLTKRPFFILSRLANFLIPVLNSGIQAKNLIDSSAVVRNHPLKLKSRFTNLYLRASISHPLPFSRHPPHTQGHSQLLSTLPLEIQRQICAHTLYSYGAIQHIILFNNKLIHMRCTSPTSHIYFQTYSARLRYL